MLTLMGGGNVPLPYAFNPSGGDPLPDFFLGGAVPSVIAGVLYLAPTEGVERITNPGFEGAYTAGLAASWGKTGLPTISEENADVHSGLAAQKFTAVAQNNAITQSINPTVANRLYHASVWGKRLTTVGAGTARALYGSAFGFYTAAAWTQLHITLSETAASRTFVVISENGTTNFDDYLIDDASVKEILIPTTIRVIRTNTADVKVSVALPSVPTAVMRAGVVARVDDVANPQNYLCAYYNGTAIKLDKYEAGVKTELITDTIPFVAGAKVEIWVQGTTAQLRYNNSQIGVDQVVAASSANRHGLYSTYGSNALGEFSLIANPF
jgi:hypothetical protein